jgi:uncharacterized protein (DUF4415 family)
MKSTIKDLPPITDEEEARIQAGIANDPDNPELTEEEIAAMRPAREVLHPDLYAALTRDRPTMNQSDLTAQEQVTIFVDRAVLDHFRSTGPDWRRLINETLKEAIKTEESPTAQSAAE